MFHCNNHLNYPYSKYQMTKSGSTN